MTAPEVKNPAPTVDAAIDCPQPVRNQDLHMVLERARDQLRQLTRQRQEIIQRIALIKRTVNGLALLCGRELQRSLEGGDTGKRGRGITKACRVVLNRAGTPLSAREVYAILQGEFPALFLQQGNHYASLVTILNRLAKHGEADTVLHNGSRFWQRHQSIDQRSAGPSGA